MKILIADDHPLFRDAFKGILIQLNATAEIVEMGSFAELMDLDSAEAFNFDIAFVDLSMPKGEPYNTIEYLSELNPDTPIIVVSGEEAKGVVRDTINSGAIGFLPKSLDTDSLINNLKHILSGAMSIVSPVIKKNIDSQTLSNKLTERQQEVFDLMCEGQTNKMIARALELTEGTVKLHVRAVLQALGASNRTQAVSMANKVSKEEKN